MRVRALFPACMLVCVFQVDPPLDPPPPLPPSPLSLLHHLTARCGNPITHVRIPAGEEKGGRENVDRGQLCGGFGSQRDGWTSYRRLFRVLLTKENKTFTDVTKCFTVIEKRRRGPQMTQWGGRSERGRDIWLCLLTVGLAGLKINKFFDDKDPTDCPIASLAHSLFATASLCPLFPRAVSMGWGRRASVVCVRKEVVVVGEELTAILLHLLSPQLPAFSFIRSPLTHYASHLPLPFQHHTRS